MANLTLSLLFLLVTLLTIFPAITIGTSSNHQNLCMENERAALLEFIQGFNPSTCFASWMVEEDCCKWKGVACNNMTGHVNGLDLRSHNSSTNCLQLQGELRNSLLDLPFLTHLDLSLNDFRQEEVPEFIPSLKNLEYLNLSHANLRGHIPNQLGNLSKLHFLDLSGNGFSLMANSLDWLHGMPSLQVLDLGGVDLSYVQNWLDAMNMLSSLKTLSLFSCRIYNSLPALLPSVNFTSLEILDLSLNHFNSPIPVWLFNISQNLVHLNLTRSQLVGPIPNALAQLRSLEILELSENALTGAFPKGPSSLKELHLSHNQLKGSFAKRITHLSNLVALDVSSNLLEDIISQEFLNFSDLRVLDLSYNSIQLSTSSRWRPSFQLDVIHLSSCQLGPQFPRWLQTQKDFSFIDISSNGISGRVPDWFWNLSGVVEHMDLSDNELTGKIPDFSSKVSLSVLDLGKNTFSGLLPQISSDLRSLILSNNALVGSVATMCESVLANSLLSLLDLSDNMLSGPLPDCLKYAENLVVLNVARNNLSGQIPPSIGNLIHLRVLRLDWNAFSGEVPSSLRDLTSLVHIDLYGNMLSGKIPTWIGESIQKLLILILGNNNFSGEIPLQLCQLEPLHILDLGRNSLSGTIPRCIDNLLTMAKIEAVHSYIYSVGIELIQRYGLNYRMSNFILLDLSSNQLSGEIPAQLANLVGLVYLNLSHNGLTGAIPYETGALTSLEALDLSRNNLSCSIPSNLSHLHFLSFLNLSYNSLSGEIASEAQFQTFDSSSFENNEHLCGGPLQRVCSGPVYNDSQCRRANNQQESQFQNKDDSHFPTFYIGMWTGFITAIWVHLTVLLLSESWREAYFKFLDKVVQQIYVTFAAKGARFRNQTTVS